VLHFEFRQVKRQAHPGVCRRSLAKLRTERLAGCSARGALLSCRYPGDCDPLFEEPSISSKLLTQRAAPTGFDDQAPQSPALQRWAR
jgi:hypothetical protein